MMCKVATAALIAISPGQCGFRMWSYTYQEFDTIENCRKLKESFEKARPDFHWVCAKGVVK